MHIVSLNGKLSSRRIIMKFLKYFAIALGLVLFCVENTYALEPHVCTYLGMETVPGHNGIVSQVRKIQPTFKEKNK